MSYKSEIKRIAKEMEDLVKDDIKSKGLVDTGKLLNSVTAKVTINNDLTFSIDFFAEDYFQVLDEEFNIISDVKNSSKFTKLEGEIVDALMEKIEDDLAKNFKKN